MYKESGISVFRNESNHFQSYLFFVSAFHSTVHKHADDLSFIFMKGKTEFFVDSGLYNYELNDSMRKYMTSTYAHNTITVDNKSYEIKKENIDQAVIQNGDIESDYSYVVGKHELYPGVTINRVMLYVKNTDSILIFDKMNSKKIHTYTKVFNVGENVNFSQKAQNQFLLSSKIESNQIELINLDNKSTYQSYIGSKNPLAGYKSNVFNKAISIQQIRFSTKDKVANFRTILNAENGKGISNFYVTGDNKILNFDLRFKDGTNQIINVNLY
ncbi:heparinase II/III domain-containing protein [Gottfriedia solisilvae]|uniref:heparinase II/III domain-containing protein n=1 Tax=Gottfriedia solisilvae TaxID=1516104 RepID=UPI0038B2FA8C